MNPALELAGVGKTYGTVRALDGIDLTVRAGEVHCVLGENGAGKSTLCNLVYGAAALEEGTMSLYGRPYRPRRPADALKHGIAMVHQHFSLVPNLTVTENLLLREGLRLRLPTRELKARVAEIESSYGLSVDLTARPADLPVGERQSVEIVKALLGSPRLILLDEPTAVLGPTEVRSLMATCRRIAAAGHAVLLITHKLGEIESVGDTATVLRGGRVTGTGPLSALGRDHLVSLMLGRPLADLNPLLTAGLDLTTPSHPPAPPHAAVTASSDSTATRQAEAVASASDSGSRSAEPVAPAGGSGASGAAPVAPAGGAGAGGAEAEAPAEVAIEGVRVARQDGSAAVDGVDLRIGAGEIVGIAGVEGNGQSELVAFLSGALDAVGRFRVGGVELSGVGPGRRTAAGVGVIPEDRHHEGCVPGMSVAENLFLGELARFRRRGLLDRKALHAEAARVIERQGIKAAGPGAAMATLSGGNQQKVVLARELGIRPLRFLVAAQPTRGLDLGAVDAVLDRIRRVAEGGAAVLVVSSELSELLALCDRVMVAYRGRLLGPVPCAARNARAEIGNLMVGATP
ncbi:ATP-binding cassette domain-containing protein [Streptomyces sp. NPDC050619]|uniref:ABC transporter ATP-binding protein n=1 Tax=Streptomyces sp. NPDC050619 TaxID=3157214 RepID=UPI00341D50CC